MRHLVAEAGLDEHVDVASAGTSSYHVGEPVDPRSAAAARQRGIAVSGVARRFVASDFERFDYVVAMDQDNRDALLALAPDAAAADCVSLLRTWSGEGDEDVPDPYYGGPDGFEEVFDICLNACEALLARVRQDHSL